MIVGQNYIFLHVPKTGGTWIRAALRLSGTVEQEFKDHRPFNSLPQELRRRPAFAFVRNPWDWYISLYTHYHHNFEKRIHEFQGPEKNWNDASSFLADRFGGSFQQMHEHMADRDSQSAALDRLIEECPFPTVYRYEDGLADSLLHFMGDAFNEATKKRIRQMADSRFNAHLQHRVADSLYYTTELNTLVRIREASIIDRFGYLPLAK